MCPPGNHSPPVLPQVSELSPIDPTCVGLSLRNARIALWAWHAPYLLETAASPEMNHSQCSEKKDRVELELLGRSHSQCAVPVPAAVPGVQIASPRPCPTEPVRLLGPQQSL